MKTRSIDVSMGQISELMVSLLAEGTDVEITATGNSMRPLWRHRKDVVKLAPVNVETIKKWDVLLYKRAEDSYVLHRVVRVGETDLDFLGDAQFGVETNVPKANVLAVVKGFKRGGGKYRSVDSLGYKTYVWFWMHSLGIRYFFFRAFRRLKMLFGAVK